MKVAFSAEAQEQVERIDAWWRENRRAAPGLFAEELEAALRMVAEAPAAAMRYEPKPDVRRLLLPRSRHHLYIVEQPTRVYVVAVWSAYRARGPRL